MSSRSEDALLFVRTVLGQLGAELGLPLADWLVEEDGEHVVLDLVPPNDGTAMLGVWVVGATALVFVDTAEPVPFDLGNGEDAVAFRELVSAVMTGRVELHEYLGRGENSPYLVTWPGAEAAVNVPVEVWRRRRRLKTHRRTFHPWLPS